MDTTAKDENSEFSMQKLSIIGDSSELTGKMLENERKLTPEEAFDKRITYFENLLLEAEEARLESEKLSKEIATATDELLNAKKLEKELKKKVNLLEKSVKDKFAYSDDIAVPLKVALERYSMYFAKLVVIESNEETITAKVTFEDDTDDCYAIFVINKLLREVTCFDSSKICNERQEEELQKKYQKSKNSTMLFCTLRQIYLKNIKGKENILPNS